MTCDNATTSPRHHPEITDSSEREDIPHLLTMDIWDMKTGNADSYHEGIPTARRAMKCMKPGQAGMHPFARPCARKDPATARVTPSQLGPARAGSGESDSNEETPSHNTHHTWLFGTRLRGPQSSIAQGASGFPPQNSGSAVCFLDHERKPHTIQFSGWSSRLAGFFLFSVRTMLIFFNDFFCACFFCGPGSSTATSGFLDGFNTAVSLDASLSRRVRILSERTPPSGLAKLRCRSVKRRLFCRFFATILPSSLCILQSRLQQQCSAQGEVSRAILYPPISSQTIDYWQVELARLITPLVKPPPRNPRILT